MPTFGIDASSANKLKRTGVENYSRNLIQAMKTHALLEGERVFLYSNKPLEGDLAKLGEGWESKVLGWPLGGGWMKLRMSWEMLRRAPDVLFVPGQAPPIKSSKNLVTTVHDIGFARRPDLYDSSVRKRLVRSTKSAIKKAAKILVPSEFTKQELMEVYRVAADRMSVTLEAPTAIDPSVTSDALQRHRLGSHYFLSVGRLEKKKNVTTLLRAFELFKDTRGVGDPFELVLVGSPGFGARELTQYLKVSKHRAQIKLLGYRPDNEVQTLIKSATAFLFPSNYEGFGIPNLDAMRAGTPLITSDIPPHREVCGDAALYASPNEPNAWARAMAHIAQDATLREGLVAKGLERVKMFSWDNTAAKTWEVLRSLV